MVKKKKLKEEAWLKMTFTYDISAFSWKTMDTVSQPWKTMVKKKKLSFIYDVHI